MLGWKLVEAEPGQDDYAGTNKPHFSQQIWIDFNEVHKKTYLEGSLVLTDLLKIKALINILAANTNQRDH